MTMTTNDPHKKHVLVADDDPLVREIAASSLWSANYTVDLAEDGRDAIRKIREKHYDLAVIDLGMPGMNGFDVIKKIRAWDNSRNLPVIVITGSDDFKSIELAYQAGATSFLVKPINWTLFSHHVKYVMKAGVATVDQEHCAA